MDYLTQLISGLLGQAQASFAFSIAVGIASMLAIFGLGMVGLTLIDPTRRRLKEVLASSGDLADPAVVSALQRSSEEISGEYKRKARNTQLALVVLLPLSVYIGANFVGAVRPENVLLLALTLAGAGFLVPPIVADMAEARRKRALSVGFPEALDLLVACTEAGMGLNAAFVRVAEQMIYSHPAIAHQFNLVNYEIRGGVDRFDALKNLANRTGLDSVRSLVSILSQSMRFGTSISETLRVFAEDLRDRRMQAAEEAAAKIGTKMIFPLIFCLFPSFFIISVGPAFIGLAKVFSENPTP